MRGGRRGSTWGTAALVVALVVATPAAAGAVADVAGLRLPSRTPIASVPTRVVGAGIEVVSSAPRERHGVLGLRPAFAPPALLVAAGRSLPILARPRSGAPSIGILPATSKYYHVPITAWVEAVSANGRWGRVEIPYVSPRRDGWIRLGGLSRSTTSIAVEVDLSAHRVTVTKAGRTLFSAPAATGAPWSPTPPGEYFVTDRVAFPHGGALGTFAFGISGIQPHLPAGWSGGNQLAIHGTNSPASIGHSVSAGCVRVSEITLARLIPLLQLGTPVVIHS